MDIRAHLRTYEDIDGCRARERDVYMYIYAVCCQGRGGIRRGLGSDRVFRKRDHHHHLKKISFPKLGGPLDMGKIRRL